MRLIMKPTSVIKARLGIQPNGPVQKFFTNECAKAMDPFVPFDKGNLAETVIQGGEPTNNVKKNYIIYQQPYAIVVYRGVRDGKEINIHTDKHSLATSYWDRHMWTAKGPEIIASVQKYINRGGK